MWRSSIVNGLQYCKELQMVGFELKASRLKMFKLSNLKSIAVCVHHICQYITILLFLLYHTKMLPSSPHSFLLLHSTISSQWDGWKFEFLNVNCKQPQGGHGSKKWARLHDKFPTKDVKSEQYPFLYSTDIVIYTFEIYFLCKFFNGNRTAPLECSISLVRTHMYLPPLEYNC